MTDITRARISVDKLLSLARSNADALRVDLADVEAAKKSAEDALEDISAAMRKEEAIGRTADPAAFAAYAEGVRGRRHNLQTTLMTLEEAEEKARHQLQQAMLEIRKLEHLISLDDLASKKATSKREMRQADEHSAARFKAF